MDFTEGLNIPKPQAQAHKRRAVDSEETAVTNTVNMEDEHMKVLIKQVLSNTQRMRMTMAITTRCFRMLKDNEWAMEHKKGTVEYNSTQEALKASLSQEDIKRRIGNPCNWGFNKMLALLVQKLGKEQSEQLAATIKQWQGWEEINDHVRICRLERMQDQKYVRLVIATPLADVQRTPGNDITKWTPSDAWLTIKKMMLQNTNSPVLELRGQAPRGDLERRLQRMLGEENKSKD